MPSSDLEDMLQAPDATVRAILRALCQDSGTRSRALSYFETLEAVNDSSDTRKRKAEDELSICVQCDEAFYANDNNDKEACCYHWGEETNAFRASTRELTYHDENCHGTIDTESMREENPEGFVWTCCDKPGDEAGCYRGRHEADPTKSRRASGDEPSDLEDHWDDDDDV
ncbi:hypothetical protein FPANT_1908 [Fusarium pseudoanthophilum]|uniref:Uncharacterized protein n=1 Tax=Fusarium pseudoanthophilum TaxID=48495 RepID=A0A8H5PQJ3_9HYPO|nr:hypothetical protein FPANT_1908 [Fusarium pseudoanthophilum]